MYMFLLLIATEKTGKNPHIYRYQSFKNFIQNEPKLYTNITTYCICCKVYSSIHIYIINVWATSRFVQIKQKAIDISLIWTGWHRWSPTTGNKAFSYSSRHLIKYLVTPALKTVSVFHLPIVRVSNDHAHNLKNYLKHF